MNFMTISEVSKAFNISTRILRHYEKIGLLNRQRKEDYAYRIYDEKAVKRLQHIIVLRKLRIPLKQITLIVNGQEQSRIIEVFQKNIAELNDKITALNTIRDVLKIFISRLNASTGMNIKLDLLQDADVIRVVEALTLSRINFKEERSMEVPEPLVKKRFEGGLYAAHTIAFPDFHEWELLSKWADENEKYAPNYSEQGEEIMSGCLEEHLNWIYSSHMGRPENGVDVNSIVNCITSK